MPEMDLGDLSFLTELTDKSQQSSTNNSCKAPQSDGMFNCMKHNL